jgi:putative FmdB family regulatory protein
VPTYEYACTSCGEQLEAVQRFSDDPLTVCPACGGALRKVFSPVGIVFKGSGFYRTDSRNGAITGGDKPGEGKHGEGKHGDKDSKDKSTTKANGSGDGSSSDKKSSDSGSDANKPGSAKSESKKPAQSAGAKTSS